MDLIKFRSLHHRDWQPKDIHRAAVSAFLQIHVGIKNPNTPNGVLGFLKLVTFLTRTEHTSDALLKGIHIVKL